VSIILDVAPSKIGPEVGQTERRAHGSKILEYGACAFSLACWPPKSKFHNIALQSRSALGERDRFFHQPINALSHDLLSRQTSRWLARLIPRIPPRAALSRRRERARDNVASMAALRSLSGNQ